MSRVMVNRLLLVIGGAIIIFGAGIAMARAYTQNPRHATPLVYSENAMLQELWNTYKANNIEKGSFRTLDKQQGNITTSEGESYTMLRSVWVDDQETFDKSWQWTKDNLQRDDKLQAWKFGSLPTGQYGIQEAVGGQNTASDGDTDIALSLLMAYARWNENKYLYDAKPLIEAIWAKEVVIIKGRPVLVSNDLERNDPAKVIVNPSYFAPYAYKVFAKVDSAHDWKGLADNSYRILADLSAEALDRPSASGLVPDWVQINRKTGQYSKPDKSNLTTNYGYDAMRAPWRLALDWNWYRDERAKNVLEKFSFLDQEWQSSQKIIATYSHDGKRIDNYETPAAYGTSIGYFSVLKPDLAREIYDKKLKSLYDPNKQMWKSTTSYYDDNWAWFGMALMENALPNLTEQS